MPSTTQGSTISVTPMRMALAGIVLPGGFADTALGYEKNGSVFRGVHDVPMASVLMQKWGRALSRCALTHSDT